MQQVSVVHPRVRILHVSPNAPALDVYIGDSLRIINLAYGQLSEYLSLWPERHRLRIFPAGHSRPEDVLVDEELGLLVSGLDYTLVAIGEARDLSATLVEDDAPLPVVGRERLLDPSLSMIRFLHASPDAPAIDVDLTGSRALFRQVGFGEVTPFTQIEAGTYDVVVRRAGHDALVVVLPQYDIGGGNRYTVVALGLLDGQPAFALMPLVDAFAACPA